MLVSSQLSQVPTVERLVELWADRYLPDLSLLSLGRDVLARKELRQVSTPSGRAATVEKLPKEFVEEKCKLAAVQTKDLYTHLPEELDLREVVRLAKFASRVYLKLLEVYQETITPEIASKEELLSVFGDSSLAAWGIPKIDKLAEALEPVLLEFQEQHMISKDWRTLGFITTQINFTNALLREPLTPAERVLISPYLNFVEEQVALPWQRICAAAAKYELTSAAFVVVERMLHKVPEISLACYQRLEKAFPNHYSRRGRLQNSEVQHSCMRDLNMFQSYLWLCVLQGNLKAVEQELVALCIMVLESIGVSWTMTAKGNEILMDEVLQRLNPQERNLVQPYIDGMIKAFQQKPSAKAVAQVG